jgi:hypothetical protein
MPFIAFYTGYFAVLEVHQDTAIAGTKGTARLFYFLAAFGGAHFSSWGVCFRRIDYKYQWQGMSKE